MRCDLCGQFSHYVEPASGDGEIERLDLCFPSCDEVAERIAWDIDAAEAHEEAARSERDEQMEMMECPY